MMPQKYILYVIAILFLYSFSSCNFNKKNNEPFFFIQMADPQIGFCDSVNFKQESKNFEKAIKAANRLNPAFVVICGDLVNNMSSTRQINEFMRILRKLNKNIPCYLVAGNHDVGKIPTIKSLEKFKQKFGPDHFIFEMNGWKFIVTNSTLMQHPNSAKAEAEMEMRWLKEELGCSAKEQPVIIFEHHPIITDSINEPDSYHNLNGASRRAIINLLAGQNIKAVMTGHLHKNLLLRIGDIEQISSSAVSKSIGSDSVGIRIVKVFKDSITHTFYPLNSIPKSVLFEK